MSLTHKTKKSSHQQKGIVVRHEFGPFYQKDSIILILGSFPSVKSREASFYYAHPQNRFWKLLAKVFSLPEPQTLEEKKQLLARKQIALWDVIDQCEIVGSQDASIRNVVPTDLFWLVQKTSLRKILLNGKAAEKQFRRWYPDFSLPVVGLPSTSPANAAWSLEQLDEVWKKELTLY